MESTAAVRALLFLGGASLVVVTLRSAVRTFILPRASNTLIARLVFRAVGFFFRRRAVLARSYEARDRAMELYAPAALLVLPAVWLVLVGLGYTGMYVGLGVPSLEQAFSLSGSSLLTLGTTPPQGAFVTLMVFSEAAIGLALIALLIAYLPTMYAAFSRREAAVAMLEVRAGSPPSAITMFERHHRLDRLEKLGEVWTAWESWFADIEESHTSLAALVFFRSPQPHRSWVTAAGAVLDAASLATSTLDIPRDVQADLCIRAGYLALREIASFYRIPFDPDPHPGEPISISRPEYEAACDHLASLGLPLKADRDQAWRDFAGWRVNYDTVLLGLARLTVAPYAPWSSDRSAIGAGRPRPIS
ncbi:MAG: hypothetical protein MUO23_13170 [Anaerolineales bacterium]|nr:hypothetical protein [Anaerolineales bacterium]